MRSNRRVRVPAPVTHEGAIATPTSLANQLRRAVLSTLLWEDTFYESGVSIADRIRDLAAQMPASEVVDLAREARHSHNLRSVPLWLLAAVALARTYKGTDALCAGIQHSIGRADEIGELVSLYWKGKGGRAPLPAQMKRGLAAAFGQFNAFQLARYDRAQDAVRLLDIMRLVHPKPTLQNVGAMSSLARAKRTKALVSARSWEHQLSETGRIEGMVNSKVEAWSAQLEFGKLGYMALLKNLRNMVEAGVKRDLIEKALRDRKNGADQVLPFRYISAWRAAPSLYAAINDAFMASLQAVPRLQGRTAILVDVSGSMDYALAQRHAGGFRKGQKVAPIEPMKRMDAAAALAVMFPSDDLRVFSFSNHLVEVPARAGLISIDAIRNSQPNQGTQLFEAVRSVSAQIPFDRLVVISDEQAARDVLPLNKMGGAAQRYLINVAPFKNGVSYTSGWTHIDGFSEATIRYIAALEGSAPSVYD